MRTIHALTFITSFVLSTLLLAVVRRIALRIGYVDHPRDHKKHARTTPYGGGVGMVSAVVLTTLGGLAAAALAARGEFPLPLPAGAAAYAAGALSRLDVLALVLGGGVFLAAVGVVDDVRDLGPRLKLAAQLLVAATLAMHPELRITLLGQSGWSWAHVGVTVVWIVLMINSFNMLDNMDGQSALIAFLTGSALLVLSLQTGQLFIAELLLALVGAVLGFLLFNFPPASMFMGDAGSMFLGYLLAVSTVLCSFVPPSSAGSEPNPFFPLLVPLVIFAVPLYDAVSVMAIRFHQGRPLMVGDRSHFSHRLMRLGMRPRMVLSTVGLIVIATASGATIPYGSPTWQVFVPAVQAGAVILVILQLEWVSAHNQPRAD
jgi:UDP-GlcNAc:undecaprenyl-phosphate GlcNAc-1-phosphate transferase